MTLSAPYRQKNYMGEYAAETGGGSALEFIQANKWDSSGDGAGTPRAGMMFFDTAAVAMKVYSGSAWAEIGGGAQLSDLSDVGDTTVGAGRLLISDADSWESQLVGGAITLSSSGATAFNATSEASADDADLVLIYDDDAAVYKRMTRANFLSGAGASQLSDLSDVGVTTATAGRLLVADGDSWESQTISGAITMASDGGTGFIADSELTADDADLLLIYDDSESEYRRMTRANFLSGVGAAPGGTTPQLQYNDGAGDFAAATNVRYDSDNDVLMVGPFDSMHWSYSVYGLVVSKDDWAGMMMSAASDTAATSPFIILQRVGGTHASPTVTQNTHVLGSIAWNGLRTTGWSDMAQGAAISATASQTWEMTKAGTKFEFKTATNDTATAATRYEIDGDGEHIWYGAGNTPDERLRLENEGPILFPEISAPGTTTNRLYNTSTGLYFDGTRLDVAGTSPGGSDGQIQWRDSGAFAGTDSAYWDDTNNTLMLSESSYTTSISGNQYWPLQVVKSTLAGILIGTATDNDGNGPELKLVRARNSVVAPYPLEADTTVGKIKFSGLYGTLWTQQKEGARIESVATETWSLTVCGSAFNIQTCNTGADDLEKRYEINGASDHIWYGAGATPSELMRLDASEGRLGIGTNSPDALLHILSEDSYATLYITANRDTATHSPYITTIRTRGTAAVPSACDTNDALFAHSVAGQYDASNIAVGFKEYVQAAEDWSASGYGTQVEWRIVANGETAEKTRHAWRGDGTIVWYSDDETTANLTIPYGEIGVRIGSATADPTGVDGQVYYKSDTDKLRLKANGSWVDVATGSGGATPGGSSTEIQYRSGASTFGGAAAVHWDATYNSMIFGTAATSSPNANSFMPIQIVSAGDYAQIKFSTTGSANYDNGYLFFSRGDGETFSTAGPPKNEYAIGQICWGGPVGTGWAVEEVAARFVVYASQDWTASVQGVRLMFETIKNGDDAEEDRFGITGDGNTEFYIDDGVTPGFSTVYGKAGVLIGNATSDPATPSDGQLYYKSDTDKLRLRANSAWVDLSPGGSSGQVQWNSTLSFAGTDQAYWDDTYKALLIGGPTTAIYDSVAYPLQLVRNGTAGIGMLSVGTADDLRSFLYLGRAKGTWAAPLAVTSGSELGSVNFVGLSASGIANRQTGVELRAYASEAWSGTQYGTKFDIATVTNGTTSLELRYGIEGGGDHIWYGAGASPSQIMRIDATYDCLLVGGMTTHPWSSSAYGFVVEKEDSSSGAGFLVASDTTTYTPFINFVRANNTYASPQAVSDESVLGRIQFNGLKSTTWSGQGSGAVIESIAKEQWSASVTGSALYFKTSTLTTDDCETRYEIDENGDHVWYHGGTSPAQAMRYDTSAASLLLGAHTEPQWVDAGRQIWASSDEGSNGAAFTSSSSTLSHNNGFIMLATAGSTASPTVTPSGKILGQFLFGGVTGAGWANRAYGAKVKATSADLFSTNPTTDFTVETTQAGSSTIATRYKIDGATGDHIWYGVGASPSESLRLYSSGDLEQPNTAFHYWGDPSTNDSFRAGIVSSVFVIQQRYGGTWTTVHEFYITPTV